MAKSFGGAFRQVIAAMPAAEREKTEKNLAEQMKHADTLRRIQLEQLETVLQEIWKENPPTI